MRSYAAASAKQVTRKGESAGADASKRFIGGAGEIF